MLVHLASRVSSFVVAFGLAASTALAAQDAAARKDKPVDDAPPTTLTMAHVLDLESVASPKVSPDGSQVVFTRTWNDRVNDRPQNELWIMDADGSRLRQLGEGSAAEWSPDGKRIVFLREGKPKGAQGGPLFFYVYHCCLRL